MLSVMLLIAALPTSVEAATLKVYAGDTVTVSIPVTKGFGGEGKIVFSNEDLFSSISISGNNVGSFQEYNRKIAFANSNEITSGSIDVTVTIKTSAKAGDSCKISVADYEYVDSDDNMVSSALSSQTVKIIEDSTEEDDDYDDSTTSPTTDDEVTDTTDYTELEKQISIAEGLDENQYTKESWEALAAALEDGYNALGCGDQDKVDAATEAIKAAIAGLVEIDYSKLIAAMDSADALISSDELGKLWAELGEMLVNADDLLSSNDQAAIDEMAEQINALLAQIEALLGEDVAEVEEDVTADAEPEGEYCNIPIHKVWPILFFVSLIANIILIVLLVGKKKGNKAE